MDHTRQYAYGGPTSERNLAAACAHDHDLRDNGWQVVQTSPGHVTWISRTGHEYPVQPPPIIEPMPEPFAPNGWTGPNERGAANTHPASGPEGGGQIGRKIGGEVGGGGHREIVSGFGGESEAHGLAISGYGAGSITDPANDEVPFLPTWNDEPAWWDAPVKPVPTSHDASPVASPSPLPDPRPGPAPGPDEDIPPF
ncbi:hypothetical protein IMZ11_23110 [Microtetraspora sp. AC03309]|nr:hypothetical protein [Microtetraspora sp. AC03309]